MPILGVTASSISGHLIAPDTGAMFPLGMVSVGSAGAANITFSSIPQTYTNLQIRYFARKNDSTNGSVGINMTFNSDTSENYNAHFLQGEGSSVSAYDGGGGRTNISSLYFAGGGMTASAFGPGIIDIIDYKNTNKYKTTKHLSGVSSNTSSADIDYILFGSGLWRSTSAITSITLTGNNFAQYSQFALYGIKGEVE